MSKLIGKTLHESIQDDIYDNRTPDVARLRYTGEPIKVFLWDDMQEFKTMQHYLPGIDLTTGYRGEWYGATTVDKYLPWYNIGDQWGTNEEYYPALCLEEVTDLELVNCPDYFFNDPMPIKGKLAQVSLHTLQLLDEYYDNEFQFSRVKIEVQKSQKSKDTAEVYTWMNTLEDIFDYEPHENVYKMKPNMDLTPFKDENGFYTMG